MKKEEQIAVRVPKSIKDYMSKEAQKEGRTLSNLLFKIINDWMHERKKK